jgi:histidine triad (HIT) family protein
MMYSHAPQNYQCPFCHLAQQTDQEDQARTVYHDARITAFISRDTWPNNPGHVLIIPNTHYENIYTLPIGLSARIQECAQAIALAFKQVYHCDGTSTRQHNEPGGGQDVWHYHLHVFPRYHDDQLYFSHCEPMTATERQTYAEKLRHAMRSWTPRERLEETLV